MLVLSRKPGEKILIPGIQTSIQVVSLKAGAVRLGVEAPPDVGIFREEIANRDGRAVDLVAKADATAKALAAAGQGNSPELQAVIRKFYHDIRNRLNANNIGLALLRHQLKAGMSDGMEATIQTLTQEQKALQAIVDEFGAATKPVSAVPPPPAAPARRSARTALVVEDDRNECELLAGFLRMAGLDVATAGDGCDALDYFKTARPDVVLLDMVLPRCDGPSTARALRQDPANAGLKIFAVSGYGPESLHVDQAEAGIDRWFQKPLNPESLLRELRTALDPRAVGM